MKRLFYVLPMAVLMMSCGEGNETDAPELTGDADVEDINNAIQSFNEGGAYDGRSYFDGLLAEVVKVDVKFREVEALDEIDGSEEEITAVLDDAIELIEDGRKALDLYKNEDWPKRAEFHDLTIKWFASVEGLINDYLYELAEPMSRADETWTDEEIDFYTDYSEAYKGFYEIDNEWVDFQYEYAEANGFEIGGIIDEEAMVNEEMSNMGE